MNARQAFETSLMAQRVATRFAAADTSPKGDALVEALAKPPYSNYIKLKSHRGAKAEFTPNKSALGSSELLVRFELLDLDKPQAKYRAVMKNKDAGWSWDEYRKPAQFHDPFGTIKMDRMPDPTENPTAFASEVESLFRNFAKGMQRVGFVFDEILKRVVPLAKWEEDQRRRQEAEAERQRAKAEAEKKRQEDDKKRREEAEKQQREEPESEEAWSVVQTGLDHSYATDVNVFSSKTKAEQEARDIGNCYVVKGTQMWNEPLGQVEEHNRPAPYRFFK